MRPGDPRADPAVIDLIELAGLWLAAEDWAALGRTLRRLDELLEDRFRADVEFAGRFRNVLALAERAGRGEIDVEEVRRRYRRATLG